MGDRHVVRDEHTARAVGSGDLDVLGTPVVVAWCEAATVATLDLPPERTSVGVRVEIDHLAASPVGMGVTIATTVVEQDDRRATFEVTATDDDGTVVAQGQVKRAIVDRTRFLDRLPRVGD